MNIDMHTHIVPENFPPVGSRAAGDLWPRMEPQPDDGSGFARSNVIISGRNFRTVLDRCWSTDRRIAEMPDLGIDRQVLSPMPELLAYRLEPGDGQALGRHLSETIVRMVDANPDRFYGLGAVPLQDVELAAKELSHLKGLGLPGVEILSNIQGLSPGDPKFLPFFKEAESLGMAVFIHSQHPTFTDRIVGPGAWVNAVGFPTEAALAATSLIGGGTLEACPDLRVCISHGGGTLSQILPRLDYFHSNSTQDKSAKTPTEYARQMYYDDILFSNQSLRLLIDTVGTSQVVVGSDYPFQFRPQAPAEEYAALGLTPDEIEAISSANCLRFLGLTN
jgi:aminocarboxymuconate-semialdehyde decarboxylase